MPSFAYSGRTRGGREVNGEYTADSVEAAVAALRRDQILVTKINPAKAKAARAPKAPGARKVKLKTLAIFTRQFSVMIDAGLPLVQCLEVLGAQEVDKRFGQVILGTRGEIEGGASLADGMRKFPKVFDPLYTNMIAAGEAGGILDTILKRLATYLEKNAKLQSQVRSAMVYPAAVMSIAVVVVAVILWQVIPTFSTLFAGFGAELPLPTLIVIWMSETMISYFPVIVGAIALVIVAVRRYYGTDAGRHRIDAVMLKLPVIGLILRKIAVARFCRTLSTLLSSGVPILDGLEITAKTSGNVIVEDAVMVTRSSIERGETVSGPLRDTRVFPPMVAQMIAVGETTGALDTMLGKIADFYEDEVDVAVAGLLTLLEPLLIAFLGVIVGGIVLSMYLPIFDLISKLT